MGNLKRRNLRNYIFIKKNYKWIDNIRNNYKNKFYLD